MSSFLKKVEGYVRKDGTYVPDKGDKTVHKPAKAKKPKKFKGGKQKGLIAPFKPNKPVKSRKSRKFEKSGGPAVAEDQNKYGKTVQKASTNFVHLRKLMALFEQKMQFTNPFDIKDPVWNKFLKEIAPELLVTVLWDLGHVTNAEERRTLIRLFKQHIRT